MPTPNTRCFTGADLATHLAAAHPDVLSESDANAIARTLWSRISAELAAGNNVRIPGFGTFFQSRISSRTITAPGGTGSFRIPTIRCIRFRTAKSLRDAISAADGRPEPKPVNQERQ